MSIKYIVGLMLSVMACCQPLVWFWIYKEGPIQFPWINEFPDSWDLVCIVSPMLFCYLCIWEGFHWIERGRK